MPGVNSQTSASELTNYLLLGSDHVRFEPRWWEALILSVCFKPFDPLKIRQIKARANAK